MRILDQLWIIPALPLLGAALNGLLGWPLRWSKRVVDSVALGTTGLAFLGTLELIREFRRVPADQLPIIHSYIPWIAAGTFHADLALELDQLTIIMLLVVTGVGWLIHVYSTGYMAHDEGYTRFFSYLNLFMFFMLVLVLAANYAVMFVGWEGVGLSSYLLIGFYYLRKSAADAGKKAFIVNRVGDFGFLLAMFLIFRTFASLDFDKVFSAAAPLPTEASTGVITAIALLLFVGAVGKSAQLPLYVWLPDAMEGPTPVSALIHAATMVTAGVYMVARSHVLYEHAPMAMLAVAIVGAVTALFAATIGLVQNDIKKVLAYSTVSQLGYMFLACGVGAFSAGIFHLMTHAFFKGLLFLAAGSVIHAMGGEQDMRNMGGLRRRIPWTYWTMLMATLAIAGAPGFAGFFSKDAILEAAASSEHGNIVLYILGLLTALLTSFYMFRLLFLTFYGSPRYDEHQVRVHESGRPMIAPLVVLAVLSVCGGWLGAPQYWGGGDHFETFVAPVFEGASTVAPAPSAAKSGSQIPGAFHGSATDFLWIYAGIAVGVALIGFLVAWWFYIRRRNAPERLAQSLSGPYKLLLNKYYVDEIYDALIVNPLKWISTKLLWHTVDERVIDGTVNGVANETGIAGERVRRVQSGNPRSYAAWVIAGVVLFLVILLRAVR